MRGLLALMLLLLASLTAQAAMAQAPARIEMGQVTTGKVSADGGNFYVFAGVGGTKLTVFAAIDTLAAVALYDAQGNELAMLQDRSAIFLHHTLPEDGIYLLGITSAVPNLDYTLMVEGELAPSDVADAEPAAPTATTAEVPAPAAASPAVVSADPAVWGVYARLVGRRTQEVKNRYTLVWLWQEPGKVLLEQWQDGTGKVRFTTTIRPAGEPGRLLMHTNYLGDKDWDGTITAEGNVNFIGRGMFKFPYQAALTDRDVFEMRRVQASKGGELVHPAEKHSRWPMEPQAQ